MSVAALQAELRALARLLETAPIDTLRGRTRQAEGTLRQVLTDSKATTAERAIRSLGSAAIGVDECAASISSGVRALADYHDGL